MLNVNICDILVFFMLRRADGKVDLGVYFISLSGANVGIVERACA